MNLERKHQKLNKESCSNCVHVAQPQSVGPYFMGLYKLVLYDSQIGAAAEAGEAE